MEEPSSVSCPSAGNCFVAEALPSMACFVRVMMPAPPDADDPAAELIGDAVHLLDRVDGHAGRDDEPDPCRSGDVFIDIIHLVVARPSSVHGYGAIRRRSRRPRWRAPGRAVPSTRPIRHRILFFKDLFHHVGARYGTVPCDVADADLLFGLGRLRTGAAGREEAEHQD